MPASPRRSLVPLPSLATLLVALSACGDASTAPTSPATPPVVPVPVVPADSVATPPGLTRAGCGGVAVTLTADEAASVDLHAGQRATSGLPAFCVHPALVAAARAHAADMLARGYFAHTSPDGGTFVTRAQRAGYTGWRALAENIAWGSGSLGTPGRTFTNWMNSEGHRRNILNPALREIGVGVVGGRYQTFDGARMSVANFGAR